MPGTDVWIDKWKEGMGRAGKRWNFLGYLEDLLISFMSSLG